RIVGADGVFTQHRAGICRVAEYRNCKRESSLHLINGRELPISCGGTGPGVVAHRWNRIDSAQSKAVPHVTSRAFLGGEIIIVLRNGSFEHRRAKIRSVTQVLRPCVVSEERQSVRIAATYVYVSGVIPALRRVLQEVDGAYRKTDGAARAARRRGHIGDA